MFHMQLEAKRQSTQGQTIPALQDNRAPKSGGYRPGSRFSIVRQSHQHPAI